MLGSAEIIANNDNPRLQRWSISLQRFDFDVRYKPGSENTNATGSLTWGRRLVSLQPIITREVRLATSIIYLRSLCLGGSSDKDEYEGCYVELYPVSET